MTDAEILADPIFREAFLTAIRDPDLIDDVIAWNDELLESFDDPDINRRAVMAAANLIAKHSGGIQ
jgi:hypothetical protein